MNVNSISSLNTLYAQSSAAAGNAAAVPSAKDSDGHEGHAQGTGGAFIQAVQQTLSQWGLPIEGAPTPPTGNAASSATAEPNKTAGSEPSDTALNLKDDFHSLVYALFHALKSQQPSGTSSTPAANALGSELSTLATQAANGLAPSALQIAFSKWLNDIQAATANNSQHPTLNLQNFLSSLQHNLGAESSPFSAVGGVLQTQA